MLCVVLGIGLRHIDRGRLFGLVVGKRMSFPTHILKLRFSFNSSVADPGDFVRMPELSLVSFGI